MKNLPIISFFLFASAIARSQELFVRLGDEVIYKNNHFGLAYLGMTDTIVVTDPVTGDETIKVLEFQQPVSINGKKIYASDKVSKSALPANKSLDDYLINKVKTDPNLKWIDEGLLRLYLHYIILDEKGKVVYYSFDGLKYRMKDQTVRSLNYDSIIDTLLTTAPAFKPATLNGKKVPVLIQSSLPEYIFNVENHYVTWCKKAAIFGIEKF